MNPRICVILLLGTLLTAQCQSGKKPASGGNDTAVTDTVGLADLIDSINVDTSGVTYMLLSPNEILGEIFANKNKLNPLLVNPKNNASRYIDTKRQALNLGVYIADFAYLNLSENKTNALDYFKIIRDLAQRLNIYGYFNEEFFSRIENNLANTDSLINISKEMYYSMSDLLENAKRQNIFALISSGALIETLYLSAVSIDNIIEYKTTAPKILEQKYIFDNFYAFAAQHKNDKDVRSVLFQLTTLKKILDEVEKKTTEKVITNDKEKHIIIKGGDEIVLEAKAFDNLKDDVIKIRQEIISIANK